MPEKQVVINSTYEVIEDLESRGKLNQLIRKGIVAVDWIDHLNIYRTYKKYLEEGNKVMESYKITATIHCVHPNTVYGIRKKMES